MVSTTPPRDSEAIADVPERWAPDIMDCFTYLGLVRISNVCMNMGGVGGEWVWVCRLGIKEGREERGEREGEGREGRTPLNQEHSSY